jgi:AraC-like DNA-binding protein
VVFDRFEQEFYFHHDVNIRHSQTQSVPPHYHNRFEIYLITDGNCTYFIDNKTYRLQVGDLVLIPAGVIHNTKYAGTVHSRMLINCSEHFIPTSVISLLPKLTYLYRNPAVLDEVCHIFEKIKREYGDPDRLSEDMLRCYTNMLFLLLARNAHTCEHIETKSRVIEQAVEYMQGQFCAPLSLNEMARHFSMSPQHFSRLFKKETGMGFNKYLNALRLQKAERWLKQQPHVDVTEIAAECGFADSNYFSKKFKEQYGLPPKRLQTISRMSNK